MFKVITFYKFIPLKNIEEWKLIFKKFCDENLIKGTILLAEEGINSSLSGKEENISKFISFICGFSEFADMEFKHSTCEDEPFKRMKVKLKKEIVTFKVDDLDMSITGTYLNNKEWDEMLENSIVIDTRNDYEITFGTFKNAINPNTKNFSDFPNWAEENLSNVDKDKNILMCCTGGVRCEKSTAFMMQKMGFKNVYHLKGGILNYLENGDGKQWTGDCFVFDDRVAVGQRLEALNDC